MKGLSWSTTDLGGSRPSRTFYYVAVLLFIVLWAFIFYSTSLQSGDGLKPPAFFNSFRLGRGRGRCAGRYVYMYDLPPRFNSDLVRDCRRYWLCPYVVNDGFGPAIEGGGDGGFLPETGAYDTDQFMLGVIFHARMRRYECLTADPAAAAAVYVPFYAGLDAASNLYSSNMSARDALPRDIVQWLARRPEWRAMGGHDHFMVSGRCTWDLIRVKSDGGWGNALMTYPAIRNMTVLAWEASPLQGNDFAVPFPSHFHPSSDAQVVGWQGRMRRLERRWLWCFAGWPRPSERGTGRPEIIEQCGRSSRCGMFRKAGATTTTGTGPGHTMELLESAEFCIQPPGDTYTRKSTFDAILAGCIPVFLHPISAYVQYTWYLPRDYKSYSVFIPQDDVIGRNASVEDVLSKITPAKVAQMREEVIRLIPTVMYRDPAAEGMDLKDAFDIAVERLIDRVAKRRRAVAQGQELQVDGYSYYSWKYDLLEDGKKEIGPHEFDPYMH